MPLRQIIEDDHDHAFSPEDVKIIIDAFEDTLRALNLADRTDPLTMLVARRVMALAKQGERDRSRLRERTLATIR